jgi:hypothetical protein
VDTAAAPRRQTESRVATTADFFRACENYLAHDEPMTLEPVSISEAALDLPAAF